MHWELWNIATICERTGLKRRSIEKIVARPDFPMPIRPTGDDARPRWVASEVVSWFEGRRQQVA